LGRTNRQPFTQAEIDDGVTGVRHLISSGLSQLTEEAKASNNMRNAAYRM
jgi:hypothetical protein